MKTIVFAISVLVAGASITSCEKEEFYVIPSEKVITSNLSVSGINSIEVSCMFNVYVSFSATEESAYIDANENLHSLIHVHQDGERLVVGLKRNTSFSEAPVLNLLIKTPSLKKVFAEGKTMVSFENHLVNNQFEIVLTGASMFRGSVETGNMLAKIEGASSLELDGSADNFQINATGASEMKGFDFATNQLEAYLDGGCKVSLTVRDKLDVEANGASVVYYKGNGIVEHQNLKGASAIIKIDL